MTATLTPTEGASTADRTLRMLPIAVNLLPPEVAEARRGRKLKLIVLRGFCAVVVLVVAWFGLASYQTATARDSVTSAEDKAQRLLLQQRAFADLVKTQAQSTAISAQLRAVLADDLQWSRLLDAVQAAAPAGVQVTSVSGELAAKVAGGNASAAQPGAGSSTTAIGTLTVMGRAPNKPAVAACVDALAKVNGLGNPLLASASQEKDVVQFSVRLDITRSALGGRYAAKDANAKPNNGPGSN